MYDVNWAGNQPDDDDDDDANNDFGRRRSDKEGCGGGRVPRQP